MITVESWVLAFHFACTTLAVGLPVYVFLQDVRRCTAGTRPANHGPAARFSAEILWHSIGWLLATAATGLVYGWMIWGPDLQAALGRLSSRVFFATIEFAFSLILLAVCAVWIARNPHESRWKSGCRAVVLLVGITNLLYHFPPLFTVLSQIKADPLDAPRMSSAEFRQAVFGEKMLLVWVHMAAAAMITAGLYVQTMCWRLLAGGSRELDPSAPSEHRPADCSQRTRHRVIALSWIAIWISGLRMQLLLPRDQLFWLYSSDRIGHTFVWMLTVIALTFAQFILSAESARGSSRHGRFWLTLNWILLAIVFWQMALLTRTLNAA